MYYSRRSRVTLSLLKKDQVNKKRAFYVGRAKDLPYLPFLTTPLLKTLQTVKNMFPDRVNDATPIPKVAILFNDNKGKQ